MPKSYHSTNPLPFHLFIPGTNYTRAIEFIEHGLDIESKASGYTLLLHNLSVAWTYITALNRPGNTFSLIQHDPRTIIPQLGFWHAHPEPVILWGMYCARAFGIAELPPAHAEQASKLIEVYNLMESLKPWVERPKDSLLPEWVQDKTRSELDQAYLHAWVEDFIGGHPPLPMPPYVYSGGY